MILLRKTAGGKAILLKVLFRIFAGLKVHNKFTIKLSNFLEKLYRFANEANLVLETKMGLRQRKFVANIFFYL